MSHTIKNQSRTFSLEDFEDDYPLLSIQSTNNVAWFWRRYQNLFLNTCNYLREISNLVFLSEIVLGG